MSLNELSMFWIFVYSVIVFGGYFIKLFASIDHSREAAIASTDNLSQACRVLDTSAAAECTDTLILHKAADSPRLWPTDRWTRHILPASSLSRTAASLPKNKTELSSRVITSESLKFL